MRAHLRFPYTLSFSMSHPCAVCDGEVCERRHVRLCACTLHGPVVIPAHGRGREREREQVHI